MQPHHQFWKPTDAEPVTVTTTLTAVSTLLPNGIRSGTNRLVIINSSSQDILWALTSASSVDSALMGRVETGEMKEFPWQASTFDQPDGTALKLKVESATGVAYLCQGGKPLQGPPFLKPSVPSEAIDVTTSIAALISLIAGTIPVGTLRMTLQDIGSTNSYWALADSTPTDVADMALMLPGTEHEFNWENESLAKIYVAAAASQKMHVLFEGR